MRIGLAILAVAVGVIAAGCGAIQHMTATSGNAAAGKQLFLSGSTPACANCHTLADAQATGTAGPDLDAAFGPERTCQGFKNIESTIRDVVRGQIAYADEAPDQKPTSPGGSTAGMPANLLVGQQAKDVAAYVASVAGVHWDCKTGAVST